MMEIGVHSDGRGDAAEELKITQKRADAIIGHLKVKGISKERLTAKGYGITRLLNNCGPGVTCTDAEHAENPRREGLVGPPQRQANENRDQNPDENREPSPSRRDFRVDAAVVAGGVIDRAFGNR